VGWPLGVLATWFALNLGIAAWRKRRKRSKAARAD
jgi:cardiolipin synthase